MLYIDVNFDIKNLQEKTKTTWITTKIFFLTLFPV